MTGRELSDTGGFDVAEEAPAVDTTEWPVRLIQLLAVPGIILAYYLWLFHQNLVFPTCPPGSIFDCGQVSGPAAPYAEIGGVPVALLGLIGYAVIFLLVWLRDWLPDLDANLPLLLVGVTGLGFAFTLYLTALEAFVIHAYCQYCLISAGIITIMFILSLINWRTEKRQT